MSILSARMIRDRLSLPVDNPKSLVVTPILQADRAFDLDSLDLRLGTHFLLPQLPPEPFHYPSKSMAVGQQRIHVPIGAYIVVPAHQTVLGATLEFIKLPYDISGEILTKSSVARTFVLIETAPWIHPSYRGCLTLEIANVSNTPLLLYPGRLIGQLVLMDILRPDPAQKLSGSYLGPVYPEAPLFKDPSEDLADIGIKRYRDPLRGWQGTRGSVSINFDVDKQGAVDQIKLTKGEPPFARSATDSLQNSTFRPFSIGTEPQPVKASIQIEFEQ